MHDFPLNIETAVSGNIMIIIGSESVTGGYSKIKCIS